MMQAQPSSGASEECNTVSNNKVLVVIHQMNLSNKYVIPKLCQAKTIRSPYKPSILLMEHGQTVHPKASYQGLHCLLTEYPIKI